MRFPEAPLLTPTKRNRLKLLNGNAIRWIPTGERTVSYVVAETAAKTPVLDGGCSGPLPILFRVIKWSAKQLKGITAFSALH
jgi:hypothetical protein